MTALAQKTRIVICGSGACSHTLAGVFSRVSGAEVAVLTRDGDKVRRWRESAKEGPLRIVIDRGEDQRTLEAGEILFTDDAAAAARDCDLVIFAIPAFTHAAYIELLRPYLEDGCTIVGLPGQNGFEWETRAVLGERLDRLVLLNYDSYPWVSRLDRFAREVRITGFKRRLVGAAAGDMTRARVSDPIGTLQTLLGEQPRLATSGPMLAITLMALNAYSHPPMMYGRWRDWDGVPLAERAYFYREVDEETGRLLEDCSAEVVACANRIMEARPDVDLSRVIPMYEWDMACYGDVIEDATNQMTVLRTNPIYKDIRHPMIETEAGFVPDFEHRFLSEDVPYGLAVIRGVAEIAGQPTPRIDEVLRWSQRKLGRSYLEDGKLKGADVAQSRCPQRYGIRELCELLGERGPSREGARESTRTAVRGGFPRQAAAWS